MKFKIPNFEKRFFCFLKFKFLRFRSPEPYVPRAGINTGQRQKPAWKQAEGKAIIYAQIPLKIAKIKRIIRMLCKSGNRHGQIVSLKANEDTSQSFKDTIKKKQRKSPMAGVSSQPEQLKNRQERTSQQGWPSQKKLNGTIKP